MFSLVVVHVNALQPFVSVKIAVTDVYVEKIVQIYVSIWTKKRNSINNQMNCLLKFYHASERQCFLFVFISFGHIVLFPALGNISAQDSSTNVDKVCFYVTNFRLLSAQR